MILAQWTRGNQVQSVTSAQSLTLNVTYVIEWHHDSGPVFWRSAIPKVYYSQFPINPKSNPKADPNPITSTLILTLNLTLTQTLALWRVSGLWTFEIEDLRNSGPVR